MILKLKFLMSGLWLLLKPIIELFLSEMGKALAASAAVAVARAESLPAGTRAEERRKVAFSVVKRDMETAGYILGVKLTTSMIFAAIEVALQAFKAKEG